MKQCLWRHDFCPWRHQQSFTTWFISCCRCGHVTKVWKLYHFCKRSYNNLNFIKIWQEKPHFEGLPWFKFNNLGLALGIALKFYTSVAKESKLKVRKFWCLIRTFVEVTGEKLVGSGVWRVCPLPLPRIGLILSLVFTIIFRFLRNW